MSNPVTSAPKYRDFGSDRKLAKALIDGFPHVAWGCQAPALAAKIGALNKGDATWWRTRSEPTQTLANLLEIPIEDLGVLASSASFIVSFADFPALKPLDLKREAPWRLGQEVLDASQAKNEHGRETLDEWLEPNPASWRPPSGRAWLHVESPIEQQLLTQKLLAAGHFDVLVVSTLADAEEQLLGGKPLIVSVSEKGGEADIYAMAGRPADSAGLLVIAPFALPMLEKATVAYHFYGLEWGKSRDMRRSDVTQSDVYRGFKRWRWVLSPDWRVKLTTWVGARLDRHHPDVLFSKEDAQKWLGRFDPQSVWFSTPSDLLQLCQLMNTMVSRKLPSPEDLDGGKKLAKALFKDGPAYRQAQMAELVHKRWDYSELPWCGSLPMHVWLSLSPDALVAVSPAAIAKSANSKNLVTVRKELAKLAVSAELGHPEALLASGLLQPDSAGDYDFQYQTLAGLLVRDKLLHQVANEAAEKWGWACFDAQRRLVVDAVLDAMSLDQLVVASKRVCDGTADGDASAAVVGALEALFVAVGRRIAGGAVINAADLMPLAQCVISRLDMTSVDWALPVPWSRPTQTANERLQWITACWAWSLLRNESAPDVNWLFPGWCQTLPEAPWWVSTLWFDEKYEPASPTWLRFLQVVDEWAKKLDEPVADAPPALHIALLARAAAGHWLPDLTWWASANECVWAQDALIERLEGLGGSKAAEYALRLWPSRLEFERKGSAEDKYLVLPTSKVRRWLLGAMSPADAIDLLREEDVWHLTGVPVSLPPDFRPQLLKKLTPLLLAALEKNPLTIAYGQEEKFFERFGSAIAPLLCDFLAHDRLGFAAATCLWGWDGETASQRLQNYQHLGPMARQHLLMSCPAAYLSVATQALQANPAFFDSPALELWARQKLPNAGTSAPVLMAVLQAAHAAADNQE